MIANMSGNTKLPSSSSSSPSPSSSDEPPLVLQNMTALSRQVAGKNIPAQATTPTTKGWGSWGNWLSSSGPPKSQSAPPQTSLQAKLMLQQSLVEQGTTPATAAAGRSRAQHHIQHDHDPSTSSTVSSSQPPDSPSTPQHPAESPRPQSPPNANGKKNHLASSPSGKKAKKAKDPKKKKKQKTTKATQGNSRAEDGTTTSAIFRAAEASPPKEQMGPDPSAPTTSGKNMINPLRNFLFRPGGGGLLGSKNDGARDADGTDADGTESERERRRRETLRRDRVRTETAWYERDLRDRQGGGEFLSDDDERALGLYDRQRSGEDLDNSDLDELVNHRQFQRDEAELEVLLERREAGHDEDDGDRDRLHQLELLMRRRMGGEVLSEEECDVLQEIEDLSPMEEENLQGELAELLNRKENGEVIDDARLYELELLERARRGEDLSDDELMDLQLFELQRTEGRDTLENLNQVDRNEETESIASYDHLNLTPSEAEALDKLQIQLKAQGLPLSIAFSPGSKQREKLQMSFVSHGDESYVKDLINQRENRADERQEETLEEALELYHLALREKKLAESEQLFLEIFQRAL
jgi:hypothetical protein